MVKIVVSVHFSSVAQSCWTLFDPMDCSTPGLPVHHQPRACLNSCPSSWWCHPTISSSVVPSPPALNLSQHQGLFKWVSSSPKHWSFSFHVSPSNEHQDWFPLDGLVGSPCSPRDSQESSPAPQFKNINSSALSFLYSPTLTSIHDHWKNHSLD